MLTVLALFTLTYARILLRDDFDGNSLDSSKWNYYHDCFQKGGIQVQNGSVTIIWGYSIATVQTFKPQDGQNSFFK